MGVRGKHIHFNFYNLNFSAGNPRVLSRAARERIRFWRPAHKMLRTAVSAVRVASRPSLRAFASAAPPPPPAEPADSVAADDDRRVGGMTGAEILYDLMRQHGVEQIFGYPGGAILPVFDAIW